MQSKWYMITKFMWKRQRNKQRGVPNRSADVRVAWKTFCRTKDETYLTFGTAQMK